MRPLAKGNPLRIALFLSGKGSTARFLLENQGKFKVACLFSDNPASAAGELSEEFSVPCKATDIKAFYRERNAPLKDMKVREEFDKATYEWVAAHDVDVIALAGYMSLVTAPICDSFVTLNSHPADLSLANENGKRRFVGPHAMRDCVEAALPEIRTSIIWVNLGCDEGPILVRSRPVKIPDTSTLSADEKAQLADKLQEQLKREGDYPAYKAALEMLADGKIAANEKHEIFIGGVRAPYGIAL